eukprot:jgi/Chlat1/1341/Chrsp119S00075
MFVRGIAKRAEFNPVSLPLQAEEFDLQTNELIVRKRRQRTVLGGENKWVFEIGGEAQRKFRPDVDALTESTSSPTFERKDVPRAFQWRIRNLPYPLETYSVTMESTDRRIVIRTFNKKYFKRFNIPELDNLHLPLEEKALSWQHANNTLIVTYGKPPKVLQVEAEELREVQKMKAIKPTQDGDVECKQQ